MTNKNDNTTSDGNRPSFEVRLNAIRVSVWRNQSENGDWFNTVITRRYRDGEDWKETNTFNGLADLALVNEGARLAREFIAGQELAVQHEGAVAS